MKVLSALKHCEKNNIITIKAAKTLDHTHKANPATHKQQVLNRLFFLCNYNARNIIDEAKCKDEELHF